jgi:hypothetical protein
MKSFLTRTLLILLCALSGPAWQARAQWLTQGMSLKAGWNAVYLHVDASYTTLESLIGEDPSSPIQEVWQWAPAPSTLQFVDSPQEPSVGGSQWLYWNRAPGSVNTLSRLTPNAAYLVRVADGTSPFVWTLKGKPTPPNYQWTTTGLNFLGFPTPSSSPPTFDALLNAVPDLKRVVEIFYYTGGEFGPTNPLKIFALRTQPATRGQAYWIRSGGIFNRYFGPFEIQLATPSGIDFQEGVAQSRIVIRNLNPRAVDVTLGLVPSETPPPGQTAIVQSPPLLVRGALNTSDLTYPFSTLNGGSKSWTLAPAGQLGSEAEVVLGLNRSAMPGNVGDLYAAVLRFSDSFNHSQVDIPVSARVGSTAGLWVGDVSVGQVQHYLKSYEKGADGAPLLDASGRYVVTNSNTSLGAVSRSFPLRLIIHNDGAGQAVLLQRVFYGMSRDTNQIVATQEASLDPKQIGAARRISSIHLPWSAANVPWSFTGNLRQGGSLTTTVNMPFDDQASNPFLHTYHPDHDNLDATFSQKLPAGVESFGVRRQLTLNMTPPSSDFVSLTTGSQALSGDYLETISFLGASGVTRQFQVAGTFKLNRLSPLATLTQP